VFLLALVKRKIIPARQSKKIPVPIGEPHPKIKLILSTLVSSNFLVTIMKNIVPFVSGIIKPFKTILRRMT